MHSPDNPAELFFNWMMPFIFCLILNGCHSGELQTPAAAPAGAAKKVMVFGHRGAAGLAPENTSAAFARACGIGVDGVELDVLFSSDEELVVYHDFVLKPEITRNSDGNWLRSQDVVRIGDLSTEKLKQFDVGRLKPGTAYARRYPDQQAVDGQRIPTLREVITQVKTACPEELRLLIEVKTTPEEPALSSDPEKITRALVDLLRETKMEQRVRILSFDWRNLAHVQKIAPGIPTVYLSLLGLRLNNIKPGQPGASPWMAGIDIDDYAGSIPRAVQAAGGRFWAPYFKNLTLRDLQEAHRLGLSVYVWTPDAPADLQRMIEWGVDGIITNRPDLLLQMRP